MVQIKYLQVVSFNSRKYAVETDLLIKSSQLIFRLCLRRSCSLASLWLQSAETLLWS